MAEFILPESAENCQDSERPKACFGIGLAPICGIAPGADACSAGVAGPIIRRMSRRRYLLLPAILSLTACASTGGVPRPFPTPAGPEPETSPAIGSAPANSVATAGRFLEGYAIAGTALSLRGSPYRNGGSDPQAGFDCSGFVQFVFGQHGVGLPRGVRDQFASGTWVAPDSLEPGDLLFFTTTAPGATHVAIAIGGDQFVHAPSSQGLVRVERLSSSYWAPRFIGARRLN